MNRTLDWLRTNRRAVRGILVPVLVLVAGSPEAAGEMADRLLALLDPETLGLWAVMAGLLGIGPRSPKNPPIEVDDEGTVA